MAAQLAALRRVLAERFNETELRALAHDLGIHGDDLAGAGAPLGDLARELVAWMERRNQLEVLQAAIERERPGAVEAAVGGGVSRLVTSEKDQDGRMDAWQGQQLERLAVTMDAVKDQLGRIVAQNAVLEQRVAAIERRLDDLDERGRPTMATYALAGLGLLMTIVLVWALFMLARG